MQISSIWAHALAPDLPLSWLCYDTEGRKGGGGALVGPSIGCSLGINTAAVCFFLKIENPLILYVLIVYIFSWCFVVFISLSVSYEPCLFLGSFPDCFLYCLITTLENVKWNRYTRVCSEILWILSSSPVDEQFTFLTLDEILYFATFKPTVNLRWRWSVVIVTTACCRHYGKFSNL